MSKFVIVFHLITLILSTMGLDYQIYPFHQPNSQVRFSQLKSQPIFNQPQLNQRAIIPLVHHTNWHSPMQSLFDIFKKGGLGSSKFGHSKEYEILREAIMQIVNALKNAEIACSIGAPENAVVIDQMCLSLGNPVGSCSATILNEGEGCHPPTYHPSPDADQDDDFYASLHEAFPTDNKYCIGGSYDGTTAKYADGTLVPMDRFLTPTGTTCTVNPCPLVIVPDTSNGWMVTVDEESPSTVICESDSNLVIPTDSLPQL